MNDYLYQKVKKSGFVPKLVAEVGVYLPHTSNVLGFINDNIETILVEPDPKCVEKIYEYFIDKTNIKIFKNAIYTENTTIELYRTNASTFVSTLKSSPALVNDNYQKKNEDKFEANAIKFSEIDKGNIDILSIDTEGCEWYVISTMVSRPKVISIETHAKKYKNPYINDLKDWFNQNDYIVWYIDKSDTVFIKNNFTQFSLLEKINIFIKQIRFGLNF